MMSLVAYDTNSDSEESDSEEYNTPNTAPLVNKQNNFQEISKSIQNGITKQTDSVTTVRNSLEETNNDDEQHFNTVALFKTLPTPKSNDTVNIEETDDEFLHKKEIPIITEKRPKGPIQITIPSLSEFKDVDDEKGNKIKPMLPTKPKSCGLLGILPKPKQEIFTKIETSSKPSELKETVNKAKFIPDAVKNKPQRTSKMPDKKKTLESIADDSDESDEDFFSLNATDDKLPEVSLNEINAMVAQRAAKMAEASVKAEESLNPSIMEQIEEDNSSAPIENDTNHEQQINVDEKALHILVGSRAKRRKMEEVNIVELSSAEVLPNKDEWLRSTLSTSTQYQPTGVLVSEEPAPGTRRKHQITYLAHQAKANELELQAMWAANRHTRRQTQSKYGF